MQELMAAGRAEYNHCIIDTPPVLMFADALVLASRADAAIIVTRSGLSNSKAVLRAKDLLARSSVNILGFVLNAVKRHEYYCGYPSSYGPQYVNPMYRTKANANPQKDPKQADSMTLGVP